MNTIAGRECIPPGFPSNIIYAVRPNPCVLADHRTAIPDTHTPTGGIGKFGSQSRATYTWLRVSSCLALLCLQTGIGSYSKP